MKRIWNIAFFLVAVLSVTIVNAQEKGFKTDAATGVQYHFVKHNKKGTKPADTDIARIVMFWMGKNVKGDADSIYFDSRKRGGDSIGAINIPLKKTFHGSLEEGILMMAKGDSAIFLINSDSLLLKTFHFPPDRPLPAFVKTNPTFTFSIKLVSFETKGEIMAEKEALMKKHMEQAQARKAEEPADIATYLQKNYPAAKPDADSIFYLQTTKGKGLQVQEGDSIVVSYKGTFLDGSIFDPGTRPLNMVYSANMALIQGWVKILGKMNQGDKVRVLIPSKLAYGESGRGPIQPYTPLIFDMELVSVKSNK